MDIHKFEEAYLNAGGKPSELEKENGEYTSSKAQMGWEMWQVAKVQSVPEGFILVPRVISDEWMAVYIDSVVTKYCKDYENLPFSVEESELPEIRENHRLPIRNAHKRLIHVIEAQEKGSCHLEH